MTKWSRAWIAAQTTDRLNTLALLCGDKAAQTHDSHTRLRWLKRLTTICVARNMRKVGNAS